MDDVAQVLVRAWLKALAPLGVESQEQVRYLLHGLIEDLLIALGSDRFDASEGVRAGQALVAAGLVDERVPWMSAQVLYRLAEQSPHPDAAGRIAALLAALGQGHQAGLCDRHHSDRPHAGPSSEVPDGGRNSWFRLVFDNIAAAIAIGDVDGTLLQVNSALAEMIGASVESLQGISVYEFAHPDDQEDIRRLVFEELVPARSGTVTMEHRLMRADGTIGWLSFAITYVPGSDDHPDYLLAVGGDVTELHRRHEELHREARHDPLTGLPNRRLLTERVDELIATAHAGERAGFCFIDLDHFKAINDHYGHNVGDKALVAVANRLRAGVREQHCLLARIGGDEFVVLIPPPAGTSRTTIIADRLLSALEAPIIIGGHSLRISASIGVIVTPIDGADTETLLATADASLYNAKVNGKGHWVLQNLGAPA